MTLFNGQDEYFEDCDTDELYRIWESLGDDADEKSDILGKREASQKAGEDEPVIVRASWRKKEEKPASSVKITDSGEGGLVLFEGVQDAMRAEKILKNAGYTIKMVAPPPDMRKGCDLALEINLVEQTGIKRVLKQKDSPYTGVYPINVETAALLDIVKITDLGDWIMIKAGNMKLTYEKATGTIVNTSGGGCPDIPYFHAEMIDRHMTEVVRPSEAGFTLCAWMLDRALEEALDIQKGAKKL